MKTLRLVLSLTAMLTMCLVSGAFAADFHVTTAQELQTALSTAAGNGADDTIYIGAGTYVGHFSYVSSQSNALTLTVETGMNPGQVVLDGDNNGRVLYLNAPGTTTDITVEKLVVQHGNITDGGGGIFVATSGAFLLTGSTLTNNTMNYGSVAANAATIDISNCMFTNNHSTSRYDSPSAFYSNTAGAHVTCNNNYFANNSNTQNARGVVALRGTFSSTFTNNIFENNITASEGVVYLADNSQIIFNNNIIRNNTGNNYGAGIFLDSRNVSNSSLTVRDNIFEENTSLGQTAVDINLESRPGTVTVEDNLIADNQATSYHYGGVRINATGATVNFNRNIVRDNMTSGSYAGVYINAQNIDFRNNVIADNNASGWSGGAFINATSSNVINNTIYGNSASGSAGGVEFDVPSGATADVYNNIIWGNTAGGDGDDIYITGVGTSNSYNNNFHDIYGLWSFEGNPIDVDPQFVNVSCNDFHLTAGSGCIDSGNSTAPGIPTTDLDGRPRVSGAAVDLGAYEHSTAGYHPADVNSDWTIDATEYGNYSTAWQNSNTWATGPNPISIDYVTRAGFLQQQNSGHYQNQGGGEPLCWITRP